MRRVWVTLAGMCVALVVADGVRVGAQQVPADTKAEAEIPNARGQFVIPLFEGWYRNTDGTLNLSWGFLNRNYEEELLIPIGPDNRIEPGLADQGQPTHFVARRQWGVFTVVVPKDLEKQLIAEKKSVTWTLTTRGRTVSMAANLGPKYSLTAVEGSSSAGPAVAPSLRFDPAAAPGVGPRGISTGLKTVFPNPVTINLWVGSGGSIQREEKPRVVTLTWTKYRGPGSVKVSSPEPAIDATGKATATATFGQPGEYVLRVEAQSMSNHDFMCCWTNGYVRVSVSPPTGQGR